MKQETSYDKIVFLHIMKTAGTSLVNGFRGHFPGKAMSHGDFRGLSDEQLFEPKFITGHFGHDVIKRVPGRKYTFTFLRDPVERVLSFYHFCRSQDPRKFEIYHRAAELPLAEFLRSEDPVIREHIEDHQTWSVVASWEKEVRATFSHLSPDAILEIAKENLRGLNRVGLTETFVQDAVDICDDILIPPNVIYARENTSVGRPSRFRLSAADLEAARSLVQLDQRLYEFVTKELRQAASKIIVNGSGSLTDSLESKVRLIAFYLPQYHRIPENDAWWGEGFTDWTNVRKAEPLFSWHEQPREPSQLGYYCLEDAAVREEQANLARQHGIHGFCYYHYWFGEGKRLLEKPFNEVLKSGRPDFPFCLCWANESWTRRWDGKEHDVLMPQTYTEESAATFAEELVEAFADPRYIRVNGKPLFLVYHARHIPNPARHVEIWRNIWRKRGIGEVYLIAALTFGEKHPIDMGFDAGVEFPPHQPLFNYPKRLLPESVGAVDFNGNIIDYKQFVTSHLSCPLPDYRLYRTVILKWDNSPRRGREARVFVGCTPTMYGWWLSQCVERSLLSHPPGERFVFINAWNEWAEGSYLEPDRKHGTAFLEETRKALARTGGTEGKIQQVLELMRTEFSGGEPLISDIEFLVNDLLRQHETLKAQWRGTAAGSQARCQEMGEDVEKRKLALEKAKRSCQKLREERDAIKRKFEKCLTWKLAKPFVKLEEKVRRGRRKAPANGSEPLKR